jgi:streptogramin lyase
MPSVATVRFLAVILIVVVASYAVASAQADSAPNPPLNPYRTVENWATLPEGRTMGSSCAVDIGPDSSVWVFERCGANTCAGSNLAPVLKFDRSGKLLKSFGGGMFVFPHGLFVDREGNVWVTDAQGRDGKGHQVFKFSPEGKVLLTLGKAGVAGDSNDTFNQPSDVLVAPNGDIFVADGHGGNSNARIVKFSKNGTFIKSWGKKGTGPGEFDTPHTIAMDSKGRIFVGDRSNNRIQIFDQDGKFLAEWKQFGRPSGIFIDKHDNIYVADSESRADNHPGWKRGIRIGSAKDGSVNVFIPDLEPDPDHKATSGAEGVAVDDRGTLYAAEVSLKDVKLYVKK